MKLYGFSVVLLSTLCIAGCASTHSASTNVAPDPNLRQVDAASGKPTQVDLFSGITPKCVEVPGISAAITKPPAQGTAKIIRMREFSAYPPENERSRCNKQRIPVWVVQYQSKPGYAGPDSFAYVKKFPDGDVINMTATLNVH